MLNFLTRRKKKKQQTYKFPDQHKSRGNPSGGRGGPSEMRCAQSGSAVLAAAWAEPQGPAVPPMRGRARAGPTSLSLSLSPSLPPSGRASPAPGHLPLLRPPRAVPRDAAGGGSSPALLATGGLPLPAGDAAGRPEEGAASRRAEGSPPGRAASLREQRPPLSARRSSAQTERRPAEGRRFSRLSVTVKGSPSPNIS